MKKEDETKTTTVPPEPVVSKKTDEQEVEEKAFGRGEKNWLDGRMLDCWPKVLKSVTEPADLVAVMNSSHHLNMSVADYAKNRALFPFMASILIKKKYLKNQRTILDCRLVTPKAAKFVSEALTVLQPPWLERVYRFQDVNGIRHFLTLFQAHAENPFIGEACSITVNNRANFELALEMLQKFGVHLKRCTLKIELDQTGDDFLRDLIQILSLLQNVQCLSITFSGDCDNEEDELLKSLCDPAAAFPPLNCLKELHLFWNGRSPSASKASIPLILQAYGEQLTKLKLDPIILHLVTPDFLTNHVPNIRQLELTAIGWNLNRDLFLLAQVHWPHLECLTLCGVVVLLEKEFINTLSNFQNSMKELRILWLGKEASINPEDLDRIHLFPKLTKLTIGPWIGWLSDNWHVLQMVFQNVELLNIVIPFQTTLQNSFTQPYHGQSECTRWRLFKIMRKLKMIEWTQLELNENYANASQRILFKLPSEN